MAIKSVVTTYLTYDLLSVVVSVLTVREKVMGWNSDMNEEEAAVAARM